MRLLKALFFAIIALMATSILYIVLMLTVFGDKYPIVGDVLVLGVLGPILLLVILLSAAQVDYKQKVRFLDKFRPRGGSERKGSE